MTRTKYFNQFKSQMDDMQSQLYRLEYDVHDVREGTEESNSLLQKQQQMLHELPKGLHRSLAALALLSARQFKECPNLVWMTPLAVEKKYLKNPKKWFTENTASSSSVHTCMNQATNPSRSRCHEHGL